MEMKYREMLRNGNYYKLFDKVKDFTNDLKVEASKPLPILIKDAKVIENLNEFKTCLNFDMELDDATVLLYSSSIDTIILLYGILSNLPITQTFTNVEELINILKYEVSKLEGLLGGN